MCAVLQIYAHAVIFIPTYIYYLHIDKRKYTNNLTVVLLNFANRRMSMGHRSIDGSPPIIHSLSARPLCVCGVCGVCGVCVCVCVCVCVVCVCSVV